MDWLQKLQKPNYWLVAIAAALAALHLTILDRADQPNLLAISILFWLAIASLVWDKREDLKLESGVFSSCFGVSLIVLVILRSISPAGYHVLISPFLSGLGLCLMASGIKRLYDYWKELLILGLLLLYPVLVGILKAVDLPIITAKFAASTLWAAGFQAYREGLFIILPTGRVEVYEACSGVEAIILMLYVAILFLLMIPISKVQSFICVILAALLGFIINGLRVGLLAILVAYNQNKAFEYWHGGDGGFVFSMISVFLFGMFCWLAYVRKLSVASDVGE